MEHFTPFILPAASHLLAAVNLPLASFRFKIRCALQHPQGGRLFRRQQAAALHWHGGSYHCSEEFSQPIVGRGLGPAAKFLIVRREAFSAAANRRPTVAVQRAGLLSGGMKSPLLKYSLFGGIMLELAALGQAMTKAKTGLASQGRSEKEIPCTMLLLSAVARQGFRLP